MAMHLIPDCKAAREAYAKASIWSNLAEVATMKAEAYREKAMTYEGDVDEICSNIAEGKTDADTVWSDINERAMWIEATTWEEKKAAVYKENAAKCERTAGKEIATSSKKSHES